MFIDHVHVIREKVSHFSNLMTYMISYLRDRADGGDDLSYADFVYVSTGRSLVAGFAGVIGGILANKIGLRPTLALGATLYW